MQVSISNTETEKIYINLMWKITQLDKQKQIGNTEFWTIVQWTLQFKRMKDESQDKFLKD